MKPVFRLLCAATCACVVTSCASTPGRMLEAMARTVGLVAQADTPANDTDAVLTRGRQIEQRGEHQLPASVQGGAAVVQR